MEKAELENVVMDAVKHHHGHTSPVHFRLIRKYVQDHINELGWAVEESGLESETRAALVRLVKRGPLSKVLNLGVMIPQPTNRGIPF